MENSYDRQLAGRYIILQRLYSLYRDLNGGDAYDEAISALLGANFLRTLKDGFINDSSKKEV